MSLVWANNVPQQLISTVASTEASWLTFLLETLGSTSHLGWPSAMGSWLVKCTSWSNTKRRGRRRGTTVEGTKTTWVLAILFAIYGCFSALFLLGLVLLTVALERLVSRPGLRHLDDWVLITHIIGFAVGHWWQGLLVEGVGLMALFFGGFWLVDARK